MKAPRFFGHLRQGTLSHLNRQLLCFAGLQLENESIGQDVLFEQHQLSLRNLEPASVRSLLYIARSGLDYTFALHCLVGASGGFLLTCDSPRKNQKHQKKANLRNEGTCDHEPKQNSFRNKQ